VNFLANNCDISLLFEVNAIYNIYRIDIFKKQVSGISVNIRYWPLSDKSGRFSGVFLVVSLYCEKVCQFLQGFW